MSKSDKNRVMPLPLLINAAAIILAGGVLTMDASAFIFWVTIGVFDGHWNDISLQVLFVCLVISFVFILLVAAMFGVANKLSQPNPERVKVLTDLGHLINSGWERALRTSTTCSLVVLSLLALLSLSFWRDLLWWSELCRGMRATNEARLHDATDLYEASAEIASNDRKPFSLVMVANSFVDQKKSAQAERYFALAIDSIKSLPGDNRSLLTTAYQGLAHAYMNQGNYALAEAVLRQCIGAFGDSTVPLPAVQVRFVGSVRVPSPSPAPTLWTTLTLLEECCINQNRFDDAKKAFERNLEVVSEQTQMDGKAKLATILEISDLYADMLCTDKVNRVDLLDAAYQKAQQAVTANSGDDSLAVAKLKLQYADRLKSLDLLEKAKPEYLAALAIYRKDAEQGDFSLLKTMNNLAGIYAADGEDDKAEALYKEELDLAGHWHPQSSDVQIQVDTCRADYANLLRKLKRDADAKRIQAAAVSEGMQIN